MMKKITLFLIVLFMIGLFLSQAYSKEVYVNASRFPFYVYDDDNSSLNSFYPLRMLGDYRHIHMTYNCNEVKFTGNTSIKISYSPFKRKIANWAGIFWQNTLAVIKNLEAGYDLKGAKKLTFYARGSDGSELVEFRIGCEDVPNRDSFMTRSGVIRLSRYWKKYTMIVENEDLSSVLNGFGVIFNAGENPKGCTIYLDKIYYSN